MCSSDLWKDRRHFFHVVATATRQILVDHARKRLAARRGSGERRLSLDEAAPIAAPDPDEDLLRLHDLLDGLGKEHSRAASAVEMHYFGGFGHQEIAAALELSLATVDRDLRFARAWIKTGLDAP